MKIWNKLYSLFWRFYLKFCGAKIGKNFQLLGKIDLLLRDGATLNNLVIGDNVTFGGNIYIRIRKNGRIFISDGVMTGTEIWLVAANEADFIVGKKVVLGSYSIFNWGHGLKIGQNCIFAAFVYINSSDHVFRKDDLIQNQNFLGMPIEIGEDVWLGGHSFINKGIKIGNGAIVGAGAIVTKDIPDYNIAVGNPAKVIKERE